MMGLLNQMNPFARGTIANPMTQMGAMGSALSRRKRQTNYVIDDSMPAQSALDGTTMQGLLKQRRQQQRPNMMQGMGGELGGKY